MSTPLTPCFGFQFVDHYALGFKLDPRTQTLVIIESRWVDAYISRIGPKSVPVEDNYECK